MPRKFSISRQVPKDFQKTCKPLSCRHFRFVLERLVDVLDTLHGPYSERWLRICVPKNFDHGTSRLGLAQAIDFMYGVGKVGYERWLRF